MLMMMIMIMIHDAADPIRTAELLLLHALDFPDQPTRIFGSLHSTAGRFPLFYKAYTKGTNSSLSALCEKRYEKKKQPSSSLTIMMRVPRESFELSLMTQAERHALKPTHLSSQTVQKDRQLTDSTPPRHVMDWSA